LADEGPAVACLRVLHARKCIYSSSMSRDKGKRAELENLLRSASERQVRLQARESMTKQKSSGAPFYQSTLFWGAGSLGVAIVLTVIAAMKKDLRWLLFVATPFFWFSLWEVVKSIRRVSVKRTILVVSCTAVTLGILLLFFHLAPPLEVNVPPSLPIEQEAIYLECYPDSLPIHIPPSSTIHVIQLHPGLLKANPTFPTMGVIHDVSASSQKEREWPSTSEGKWATKKEFEQDVKKQKFPQSSPFIYKCSASSSRSVDDASIQMTVSTVEIGQKSGPPQSNFHTYRIAIDPLTPGMSFSFYIVDVCPDSLFVTWSETASVHVLDETSNRQVALKIIKREWPGSVMMFFPPGFHWNGIQACDWR
jgi:hypothetical protein